MLLLIYVTYIQTVIMLLLKWLKQYLNAMNVNEESAVQFLKSVNCQFSSSNIKHLMVAVSSCEDLLLSPVL